MNSNNKPRTAWIDVLKCIGIFYVVFGHTCGNIHIFKWIYSFHMPLFFFLSGVLFHPDKSASEFLRSKIKTLVMPYLLGGLFLELLYRAVTGYRNGQLSLRYLYDVACSTQKALLDGNINSLEFNSPLWFIPCLTVCEILLFIIVKIFSDEKYVFLVCLYCATVCNIGVIPVICAWHCSEAVSWLFWIGSGYILRKVIRSKVPKTETKKLVFIAAGCMMSSMLSAQLYENISKSKCEISFIGITGSIALSILLTRVLPDRVIAYISYIGKSTMAVLIVHMYLIKIAGRLFSERWGTVCNNCLYSFILSVFIILAIIQLKKCCNKICGRLQF